MKRLVVIFLILITCSGCAGWSINGLDIDRYREATRGDQFKLIGGAVTSIATHYLGHVAYLEANSTDWHQSGLCEIVDGDLVGGKYAAFGRAGFIAQLAVGTVLNLTMPGSFFTDGYDMGSFLEITTHPIIPKPESDIRAIRDGGANGQAEWTAYAIYSGILLLIQENNQEEKRVIDDEIYRHRPVRGPLPHRSPSPERVIRTDRQQARR